MAMGDTESFQSVKLSPVILIIGYCVIIPAAILVKPKNKAWFFIVVSWNLKFSMILGW